MSIHSSLIFVEFQPERPFLPLGLKFIMERIINNKTPEHPYQ